MSLAEPIPFGGHRTEQNSKSNGSVAEARQNGPPRWTRNVKRRDRWRSVAMGDGFRKGLRWSCGRGRGTIPSPCCTSSLKRFYISPISTMTLRGVDNANSCVVLKIALLYIQLLLKPPTLAAGFATVTSMSPVDHCPETLGVISRALASSERNRQSSSLHVAKISEGVDGPYREVGGSGPDDRVDARFSSSGSSGRGDRFDRFANFLLETQEAICREAEASDGVGRFCSDRWERDSPSESFGITRVLEGGRLLEKAACSVSVIRGVLSPERAKAMSSRGRANVDPDGGQSYSVASMSLVFHTSSPLVPTFRADVRYMEVAGEGWFGGGADLTPYYLNDGDVEGFHRFYKDICDRYDAQAYPRFKKWADEYFYIPARKEHRGVGGIFFDDLECLGEGGQGKDVEAFVRDVALAFMPSFLPIAERRGREVFTDVQRQWQLERRGRYLEFNLLYDRGVKFGLSGGRVEAIMVSAPPLVAWRYNRVPEKGSEEDRLLRVLREPREWV